MSMSEEKVVDLRVKHLEMLQSVVARMSNQSATLKNYCITITVAVTGFAISLQRPLVAVLSLLPILIFALLDAQYLRLERRIRSQFDQLRSGPWDAMPSFDVGGSAVSPSSYWKALSSWSITSFYGPLAILTVLVVTIARHIYGRWV